MRTRGNYPSFGAETCRLSMATGPNWTNKTTRALISIWGQSDVQNKLDSKNNHLLSLLLRAAISFIASLYIYPLVCS